MNENMMTDTELQAEMTRTAYNRYIRYGVASNVLMGGSDMLPGYLLNEEFSKKLVDAVNAGNVIRSLCSEVTTKDDRVMPIVNGHGQPSWVPEGSAIPMVADTFDHMLLDSHLLAATIRVTAELLKDSAVDIEQYLADTFAERILCKSISRFARNTVTLLKTVRELKGLGVSVYFEEQNIDTMSGDGEFMLTILASFAQEESRSVSENCKWRVRKKFEQGIPTGFGIYGYEVRNGSFTIVPEEAEVVRRIFRMYLDGMGSVRIMKTLIAEGIPAPEGGLWNASVIMMMLRNEKYAGDLLLQKFFTNNHVEKKQCFNRGELPQYFVAEDHEPIIDHETFDTVQIEIARRAAMYTIAGRKAAEEAEDDMAELTPAMELNDRIHCGICGKKYRRKMARLGTPYAAPIWICGTYSYRGKAYCASKQIPEKILIELIVTVLGDDYSADDIDHIEMHPNNRVLFVFADGRTEERFWKDHSRRDSWDAEKRRKATEKTKQQHQARKEREAQ